MFYFNIKVYPQKSTLVTIHKIMDPETFHGLSSCYLLLLHAKPRPSISANPHDHESPGPDDSSHDGGQPSLRLAIEQPALGTAWEVHQRWLFSTHSKISQVTAGLPVQP